MCLNIIDAPWRLATMSYVSNKFTPTMSGMVCVSSHPTTSFITQRMDMRYDDYVASNEVKKIGISTVWLNIEDGLEIWWLLSLNKGQELDMAGVWVYVLEYYRCSMKIGNYVICIQQVYTNYEWYGVCLLTSHHIIHYPEDGYEIWWLCSLKWSQEDWDIYRVAKYFAGL